MGLFTNNKKLCPVCGKPTPRLLATTVEGMPICKECAAKVDLPSGLVDKMDVKSFVQYVNYYDDNQCSRRITVMISGSLAEHWYWTLHTGCFV